MNTITLGRRGNNWTAWIGKVGTWQGEYWTEGTPLNVTPTSKPKAHALAVRAYNKAGTPKQLIEDDNGQKTVIKEE